MIPRQRGRYKDSVRSPSHTGSSDQTDKPGVRVGTYDSRAVTCAYCGSAEDNLKSKDGVLVAVNTVPTRADPALRFVGWGTG